MLRLGSRMTQQDNSLCLDTSVYLSLDMSPLIDSGWGQYPRPRVHGGLDDRFCPARSISYGVKITDCT